MRLPPSQFIDGPIDTGLFPAQALEPPRFSAFRRAFDYFAMHLAVRPK